MAWLFRKRNPEKDLKTLSTALQEALGEQLKSVIVFGSYARNAYDPKRSNLNVLIVSDLPYQALVAMGPAVTSWLEKGHGQPVLVAPDDLDDFARDFPIEFMDMLDHHKVLWGDDVLAAFAIDNKHLESQIEHDLALVQLKLRQALVAAAEEPRKVRDALKGSFSSVTVLLMATYRLFHAKRSRLDKMQAAEKLTARWKLDGTILKDMEAVAQADDNALDDLVVRVLALIEAALVRLRKN